MKNPFLQARKALVLAALGCSVLLTASSPTRLSQAVADCPSNGDPCRTLDCRYWQCLIDQAYYNATTDKCKEVLNMYNSILLKCPEAARCNLYLYGCK